MNQCTPAPGRPTEFAELWAAREIAAERDRAEAEYGPREIAVRKLDQAVMGATEALDEARAACIVMPWLSQAAAAIAVLDTAAKMIAAGTVT